MSHYYIQMIVIDRYVMGVKLDSQIENSSYHGN